MHGVAVRPMGRVGRKALSLLVFGVSRDAGVTGMLGTIRLRPGAAASPQLPRTVLERPDVGAGAGVRVRATVVYPR